MIKNQFLILLSLILINQISGHGLGSTTSVKRDKIRQPIEHLFQNPCNQKLSVSSYDFDAHAIVDNRIKSIGQSKSNCYFQISFDDNPHNDILCTPSQEFYDVNAQHWTPALQLRVGDELLSAHGKYAITSIRFIKKPLKIYALEVENTHNFFVGPYAILTHNMLLPWAVTAGLGISFGSGAAAGGTAGGCFGPITLIGGATLGGIIGIGIKVLSDKKKIWYRLDFDMNTIDAHFKKNAKYKDKNDEAQAPGQSTTGDSIKPKEENLPKSGNFPFIPPKTKDGKIPKNKKGAYIDHKGNAWKWDPKKNEWDVTNKRGHRNVSRDGYQTHKGTHPDSKSDTSKSKKNR